MKPPAALAIGGSDSSAGAGIQADLRTMHALGIKGCSAITALTAQNPTEISRIEPVSLEQLEAEIRACFSYYDIKAVKTGMLYDTDRIQLITALMDELHEGNPLIIDPVMISSSGKSLLDDKALLALKESLFPRASLITPNIPEATVLLGKNQNKEAATELFAIYSVPILLKGGHIRGERLIDILCMDGKEIAFPHERQHWDEELAHGTGCRLASAVTAFMAMDMALSVAVSKAIHFLQGTLKQN